ncbi:hypothetical protein BJ165DRAFT_1342609 [Panaeolus papilionaceus]|nr:hypothetical protein BJ165DRAFT_1342609 [Panaeolus papilionaceus]
MDTAEDTFTFSQSQQGSVGQSIFAHPNPKHNTTKPIIEKYPHISPTFMIEGQTFMDKFDQDTHASKRKINLYYPFSTKAEWELAYFLLQSGLSMSSIDDFLKLDLIKLLGLSFKTAQTLRNLAEVLPGTPSWVSTTIETKVPTKKPVTLYYRDPIQCVQSILHNPIINDFLEFDPYRLWQFCEETHATRTRLYGDWLSGDMAWFIREKLHPQATLLGVILSSDKTNISSGTGARYAHPLLLSLANLSKDYRNKATSHAFVLLALLPIPKFIHRKRKIRGILEARLFHQCLDIILKPLKVAAQAGHMLSDPLGYTRWSLLAIKNAVDDIWDLEAYEKEAMKHRLNGVHEPFWRDWILSDPSIFLTSEPLHHWHKQFWDHDAKWCINAVGKEEIDFRFSILQRHVGFKAFKEGISSLKQVTGREHRDLQRYIVPVIAGAVATEFVIAIRSLMDFRYLAQAPVVSSKVCSMITQSLGIFHQHKNAIMDAKARRGQKQPILHWRIPKLEFFQTVASNICYSGAAIQWSADTPEHAHIRFIKEPARASNNQVYEPQICRSLDRQDKLWHFDLATAIREAKIDFRGPGGEPTQQGPCSADLEDETERDDPGSGDSIQITTTSDLLAAITSTRHLPGAQAISGLATYGITNYFYRATLLKQGYIANAATPHRTIQSSPTTVFHLSRDPSSQFSGLDIDTLSKKFDIEDLRPAIGDYLNRLKTNHPDTFIPTIGGRRTSLPGCPLPISNLQVWNSVRLQSTTYHYPHAIRPPVTIKAEPGQGGWNTGIFCIDPSKQWPQSGLSGHIIADIRIIFQLVPPKNKPGCLGETPDRFLVYIQRYDIVPQPDPNPQNPSYVARGNYPEGSTALYLLKRATRSGNHAALLGDIIPLDQLCALVDIVPRFGGKANPGLTHLNSLQFSTEFWLNKYFDKELYYALTLS